MRTPRPSARPPISPARARRDAVSALKLAARPVPARREGTTVVLARGSNRHLPGAVIDALVSRGALRWDRGEGGDVLVRTQAGTLALRRMLAEPDLDPHAEQHRERRAGTVEREDGTRDPVTRNAAESPLDRLALSRERDGSPFLHPELVEAGRRLRTDFERGAMRARVTMSWEAPVSTGSGARGQDGGTLTDSAIGARERYARAVAALGPRLGPALADFACHEIGLTDVERSRDWPARSGKMMLREALDRLAAHYRGD